MTVLAVLPLLAVMAAAPPVKPHVTYTLRVDSTDLATFAVTMRVRGAPREFTIAAAAHPEYDDKYWRHLEDLRASGGTIERIDSVRWRVSAAGADVAISYRIRPPAADGQRAAWRAFLAPTGGLVGGPHSFLYVLGLEAAPVQVSLDIPASWTVATGLRPANAPRTFAARNAAELMDAPITIGSRMRATSFEVNGVRHAIVYWGTRDGVAFDTVAFRTGVERLARAVVAFWGSMPYRHYTFVFQDGAYGGLEHFNSVTIGAPSTELARDPHALLAETAHEFFHTWNLMTIRPAEYRGVDYRVQPPVAGLWFSEGLTIFYADLLRRRAGLPVARPAREQYLAGQIARYLTNVGYVQHSAEAISRAEYNTGPGALGDFDGSAHLVGELIGFVLDAVIRDATDGRRSMDDVMRLMLARASSSAGFRGEDVERAVEDVCGCDATPIFDAHVRGAAPIDFARWLALIGLRPVVTRVPQLTDAGQPAVDLRIRAWQPSPADTLRLLFFDPGTAWVKAGLRTNDRLLAINGRPVKTWPDVRGLLVALKVGERVTFDVVRNGTPMTVEAVAQQHEGVEVRMLELEDPGDRLKRLLADWR